MSRPHLCHIVDRREWLISHRWIHRIRSYITRCAFRFANTSFLAVSHAAKTFACQHLKLPQDRVAVAWNGINIDEFQKQSTTRSSDRILLGMTGRIEAEKGHRYAIEAVGLLLSRGVDVELLITGEGDARLEIERLVKTLGLTGRVRFVGWLPNVKQFYRDVDILVVPSVDSEGLPTTILEAMATGCVVVATDVGGASEPIRQGVDGFLVPPKNSHALAEIIEPLCKEDHLRQSLSHAARSRIEHSFTTEKMVDVVVREYATALRSLLK
jgi:glycosyltransferase involved in cell wall biosynthesis